MVWSVYTQIYNLNEMYATITRANFEVRLEIIAITDC